MYKRVIHPETKTVHQHFVPSIVSKLKYYSANKYFFPWVNYSILNFYIINEFKIKFFLQAQLFKPLPIISQKLFFLFHLTCTPSFFKQFNELKTFPDGISPLQLIRVLLPLSAQGERSTTKTIQNVYGHIYTFKTYYVRGLQLGS